jgi:hypothetical protein
MLARNVAISGYFLEGCVIVLFNDNEFLRVMQIAVKLDGTNAGALGANGQLVLPRNRRATPPDESIAALQQKIEVGRKDDLKRNTAKGLVNRARLCFLYQ